MAIKVLNQTRDKVLASQGKVAASFAARFVGLMGKKDLPFGAALHITPCNSIHTFFMKIPIDAVFLDKQLKVVKVCTAMAPWRISSIYWGAHSVLELPSGTSLASGTVEGDQLVFEAVELPLTGENPVA
ncbi:MAG: hypothetical protein H6Q89_4064 [Myxococcaceae bacterium]|nr:hypothetical protein [Myxococcaceae bacterium]